jgi:1,4-dihydroxy-2-naphthoate octaprenyltransferase/chlorophyll synthase
MRWLYALKPGSWSKLIVPSIVGTTLGATFEGRLSALGLALGVAFTIFDLMMIVCLNDWADETVDRIKRSRFPRDCSPKTLPDGILPSGALLLVGALSATFAIALAALGWLLLGRLDVALWGTVGVLLFLAYSLPPLRLNYRGGGELLEAVGVGVVLPLFHMSLQSASAGRHSRIMLFILVPLALCSAIASGLSDEDSDREGGKHTIVTEAGNAVARAAVELSAALGLGAVVAVGIFSHSLSALTGFGAFAVGGFHYVALRRLSPEATMGAFVALGRYKQHLHRLIAHTELMLVLGLCLERGVSW